ncbi:MAG: hypothetical protein M9899_02055 [Bdellovibrionaceae bacterium]|nr:hypothetical protein [Pseudobdellovibrionaceae bacterium]
MAHCPSCQTEIGDDFGLVNCPGCGVVCFVDLDGNAILQNEDLQNFDTSSIAEEVTDGLGLSSQYDGATGTIEDSSIEESWQIDETTTEEEPWDGGIAATEESLEGLVEEAYSAESLEADDTEEVTDPQGVSLQEDTYSDDEANAYENYEEDSLEDELLADESGTAETDESATEDFGEDNEVQDLEAMTSSSGGGSEDDDALDTGTPSPMSVDDFLNEIEVFGGMDSEPFQASAYFFDITISGIDSKDIRTEILETLSNSKLRLEEENLSKKIVAGQLQLFQIPAVKAAIIIQSLAHLNCELDWKLKEAQDLGYEDTGMALTEDSLEGEIGEEPIVEDNDSFDDLIESYDDEESVDIEEVQDGEEYDSGYESES